MMFKCKGCKQTFATPLVKKDYRRVAEDEYEDVYLCPHCRMEEPFEVIKDFWEV